jgi:hypothetical protein
MPNKWGDFLAGLSGAAGGVMQGLEQGRQRKRESESDEQRRQQFEAALAQATEDLSQSQWRNEQDRAMAARLRLPAGQFMQAGLEQVPMDILPYALQLSQENRLGAAAGREAGQYAQTQIPVPGQIAEQFPWASGLTQGQFGQYAPAILDQATIAQRAAEARLKTKGPDQWTYENSLRLMQENAAIRGDLMREGLGMMIQSDPALMARVQEADVNPLGAPLTHDQIFRMLSPEQQQSLQDYADEAAQFYWQQSLNPFGSSSTQGGAGPDSSQGQAAPPWVQGMPMTPGTAESALIGEGQVQMPPSLGQAFPRTAFGQMQFPSLGGGTIPGGQAFARDWRQGERPEQVIEQLLKEQGSLYQGTQPGWVNPYTVGRKVGRKLKGKGKKTAGKK